MVYRGETQRNAPAAFGYISPSQARNIYEESLRNAPNPTEEYILQAKMEPHLLANPQPLLIVLDLNGTLLDRKRNTKTWKLRPHLKAFIDYCFKQHSVVVWSSAKPENVALMCSAIFNRQQRKEVLLEWGRDCLGLSNLEYWTKVQCYKRLETIWSDDSCQKRHPKARDGARWNQSNTILIDDSHLKAAAQPYNHLEIPEFKVGDIAREQKANVLVQVTRFLDEARKWDDVSKFMEKRKFAIEPEDDILKDLADHLGM